MSRAPPAVPWFAAPQQGYTILVFALVRAPVCDLRASGMGCAVEWVEVAV